MTKKRKIIYIAIAAAIVIIAALAIIFMPKTAPQTVTEMLSTAQKYLVEMDYERAIAEFNKVIELDPMNADAYLGLAEAYEKSGDIDKALETLEKGFELTGDERIEAALSVENTPQTDIDNDIDLNSNQLPENIYDQDSRLVIEYIIDNNSVVGLNNYIYSSHGLELLRECTYVGSGLSYEFNNTDWHIDQETWYSDTGEIKEIEKISADNKYSITYEYLNGIIYETREEFNDIQKSVCTAYHDYESKVKKSEHIWDRQNNLEIVKSFDESGNILIGYSEGTLEYYDDTGDGNKAQRSGYNAIYYNSGQIRSESFYKDGVLTESLWYYETGIVSTKMYYNDMGEIKSEYLYDKDGNETKSCFYEYYENTNIKKSLIQYSNGVVVDEQYYDENGSKIG